MKKTKRLIHSKVTLEIDSVPAPSAGDDVSQAKTTDTDGDRLPSRTEEVEYITIDDEELEPVNSFFVEVNRDYHRGEQPRQ